MNRFWNGLRRKTKSNIEPAIFELVMKMDPLISEHKKFMKEAIAEARKGAAEGGAPIGAVLVLGGKIIGRGHNQMGKRNSPIPHAELVCLENAGLLSSQEYSHCTLYTTLSPCDMCAGAVLFYKIPVVVIGENETYKGPESYLE